MAAQDYEQVTYSGPAGAQFGKSSTEKIGFWGATPGTQRSGASQAALTLITATISGYGYATASAFDKSAALINEMRAVLVAAGLMAGS
jgi:hypothetical protein